MAATLKPIGHAAIWDHGVAMFFDENRALDTAAKQRGIKYLLWAGHQPKPVTEDDAPSAIVPADRAAWVIGYNAALTALFG